jgi:hypothetical protein
MTEEERKAHIEKLMEEMVAEGILRVDHIDEKRGGKVYVLTEERRRQGWAH